MSIQINPAPFGLKMPGGREPHHYAEWATKKIVCRLCWIAEQAKAVKEFEATAELPPLRGTAKQIAYTGKIRQDIIAELDAAIAKAVADCKIDQVTARQFQANLEANLKPGKKGRKR